MGAQLLLIQFSAPAKEVVPLASRVVLHTSVNLIKTLPHSQAQRCVSVATLNLIKSLITIKIRECFVLFCFYCVFLIIVRNIEKIHTFRSLLCLCQVTLVSIKTKRKVPGVNG